MIDKPLYQNPLGGGQATLIPNPGGGNVPRGGFNNNSGANSAIGNGFYEFNKNLNDGHLLVDPNAEAQKKANEEFLKTADEYQRGFRGSEFYKPNAPMTADIAEFIYKSPTGEDITMKGSSSGIGQFGKYLGSIGKGDLLQRAGGSFSQDLLKANPNDPYDLGSATPMNPFLEQIDTPEQLIESGQFTPGLPPSNNPYNRVGQQLMGPNQDEMLGTLKNIEGGIASLVGNYGQNFNTKQSSNYGNFDNFGIGDFFPPYGGMYG